MTESDWQTIVVRAKDAVKHERGDVTFAAYLSPSRNSRQLSAWRIALPPGAEGRPHTVDREEVVLVLEGRVRATIDDRIVDLSRGDAVLAAPGTRFSLGNTSTQLAIAWCTAMAGITATYDDGSTDTPPWAR